jgi:hypothetical protein
MTYQPSMTPCLFCRACLTPLSALPACFALPVCLPAASSLPCLQACLPDILLCPAFLL